jgi:hypothetical protein
VLSVVGEAFADWLIVLDQYKPEPFQAFGA